MTHPLLLEVEGLVKHYGALAATNQASLRVRTGDIHALIGPNGAGKTTLIGLLSGALRPDGGRVVFDGIDITHQSMAARVALGLVRSFQITQVFARLSVLDNLALAVLGHQRQPLWPWRRARADAARFAQARAVAERVGLGAHVDHLAGALSHGAKRQLELGLALAMRPKLLLLDEPMAGLGAHESEAMVALLHSLRGETTLLLVEHDMDAVFRLADRVSVLVYGQVLASDLPAAIRAHPEVQRAYLGDTLQGVPVPEPVV
ncbi:MAG: ABC transporter ATP-binding protein [Rhodoferax sp.]